MASYNDTPDIMNVKQIIEIAFGDFEGNVVNFKLIQTILFLLARSLRLLERRVKVELGSFTVTPTASTLAVTEVKIHATQKKKRKPRDQVGGKKAGGAGIADIDGEAGGGGGIGKTGDRTPGVPQAKKTFTEKSSSDKPSAEKTSSGKTSTDKTSSSDKTSTYKTSSSDKISTDKSSSDKTSTVKTSSSDKTSTDKTTSSGDRTASTKTTSSDKTSTDKTSSSGKEKSTSKSSSGQAGQSSIPEEQASRVKPSEHQGTATHAGVATDDTGSSQKKSQSYASIVNAEIEKRERELRVIHQRTDSYAEGTSSPTPMASITSSETRIEKILVVERVPSSEAGSDSTRGQKRTPQISVVTQEQFDKVAEAVREIQKKLLPVGTPTFPEHAELMEQLRKGASLTDAMAALQLSARLEATEKALVQLTSMVTDLAKQTPGIKLDSETQALFDSPLVPFDTAAAWQKNLDAAGQAGGVGRPGGGGGPGGVGGPGGGGGPGGFGGIGGPGGGGPGGPWGGGGLGGPGGRGGPGGSGGPWGGGIPGGPEGGGGPGGPGGAWGGGVPGGPGVGGVPGGPGGGGGPGGPGGPWGGGVPGGPGGPGGPEGGGGPGGPGGPWGGGVAGGPGGVGGPGGPEGPWGGEGPGGPGAGGGGGGGPGGGGGGPGGSRGGGPGSGGGYADDGSSVIGGASLGGGSSEGDEAAGRRGRKGAGGTRGQRPSGKQQDTKTTRNKSSSTPGPGIDGTGTVQDQGSAPVTTTAVTDKNIESPEVTPPGGGGAESVPQYTLKPDYITYTDLNNAVQQLRENLLNNLSVFTAKTTSSAETAYRLAMELDSKIEGVISSASRMTNLEDMIMKYADQINSLDTGLSSQMTNYQEQLTQMQHDLEIGLETMAEVLGNTGGDTVAMGELNSHFTSLQMDFDNMLYRQRDLRDAQQSIACDLEGLWKEIEMLRDIKSDREEVADALRDKAGIGELNGLVSLQQFDAVRGDFEKHIGAAFDKFNNQEIVWQKAIDDLLRDLSEKADIVQIECLKREINRYLDIMKDKMQFIMDIVGEPKSAMLSRKLFRNTACLSCGSPAHMDTEAPVGIPALPKLHLARQPAEGAEAEPKGDGDTGICYPGLPIPHPRDPRSHVCHRYCGGSHTMITEGPSRAPPGMIIQQALKPGSTEAGTDGKMYMVDETTEKVPCLPCNMPKPIPAFKENHEDTKPEVETTEPEPTEDVETNNV